VPVLLLRPTPGVVTPIVERVPSNLLGRGAWTAQLRTVGGLTLLGHLAYSELTWERIRGTSEATITIPYGSRCTPIVTAADPWVTELHLYRNRKRQWLGPVRVKDFASNGDVKITASDILRWPVKQRLADTAWFSDDPAVVYAQLLDLGIPPVVSARILYAPIGASWTKTYYADGVAKLVQPLLDELVQAGVLATAINRDVYVGDAMPVLEQDVRLLDAHFAQAPAVKVDGDAQANVWLQAGGQSSDTLDPVLVDVRDAASVAVLGFELVGVERDAAVTTETAAALRGAANLARSTPVPVVFSGGQLAQDAPVTIDELVPGRLVGVTLSKTAAPVAGMYELTRVTGVATTSSETVTIEVKPSA
jgi:hypothetical protein